MRIGKRTILVNPNITKLACAIAIVGGWVLWPKESDYVKYEQKKADLDA